MTAVYSLDSPVTCPYRVLTPPTTPQPLQFMELLEDQMKMRKTINVFVMLHVTPCILRCISYTMVLKRFVFKFEILLLILLNFVVAMWDLAFVI